MPHPNVFFALAANIDVVQMQSQRLMLRSHDMQLLSFSAASSVHMPLHRECKRNGHFCLPNTWGSNASRKSLAHLTVTSSSPDVATMVCTTPDLQSFLESVSRALVCSIVRFVELAEAAPD
eukprot:6474619-Amphidinium_carterae.1